MNQKTISSQTNTRATVTFHTSPDVKQRLDRLAEATRRSKSFLTNEAVLRYLTEEEQFLIAVEVGLKEAEQGDLIPHSEVQKIFSKKDSIQKARFKTP